MSRNFFTNLILFFIFTLFSSKKSKARTATLIPPTSPRSPFYAQILKANNIHPTMARNITLNKGHYIEWLVQSWSRNENHIEREGEITFLAPPGMHVMNMQLGNPVQQVQGVFDTGSDLVWIQCDGLAGKSKFKHYDEAHSSTYRPITCDDTKKCDASISITVGKQCTSPHISCPFDALYGDGTNIRGIIANDVITFDNILASEAVPVVIGCATFMNKDTIGIIGASNGGYALPTQLYPDDPKFSYCISDDLNKISLVKFGPDADLSGQSLNMFINSRKPFHYIDVRAILVDGKDIGVGPEVYRMSDDGKKGFFIDSGTPVTYLTGVVYDAFKSKILAFMGPPTSYKNVLELCYDLLDRPNRVSITFEFSDFSFDMGEGRLWHKMENSNLECLLVRKQTNSFSILGSVSLLGVNVGYDPNRGRLYLQSTSCPTTDG